MEEVIGLRGTPRHGSLTEWGVTYRELPLTEQGLIDWDALRTAITPSKLPAGTSDCYRVSTSAAPRPPAAPPPPPPHAKHGAHTGCS